MIHLLLLLALGGLMEAAQGLRREGSGAALAFGYVLLTAFFAGGLVKAVRLPRLTGYIVAGFVVGPAVLGLVTEQMVRDIQIVNGAAIALIGLSAGVEIGFREMRPLLRAIRWLTLVAIGGTIVVVAGAVVAIRDLLPFVAGLPLLQTVVVALLLGVVMGAKSPAVVVALRDELEADGPVTRLVLGTVILTDLVVIFLFALVSSLAKSVFGGGTDAGATAAALAWQILGSLGVGAALGALIGVYLRKVEGGAALFVLTVAVVLAEVGGRLRLDPLLVSLSAGIFIRNVSHAADRLRREVAASSLPVYVVFFAVAGATIHLDVLQTVLIPAVILVLVRGLGFLGLSRMAARAADAEPVVQRWVGFGMLPQAGLALALALLFGDTFPEFGAQATALVVGAVAINEVVAPALFRFALVRAGEAGRRGAAAVGPPTAPQPPTPPQPPAPPAAPAPSGAPGSPAPPAAAPNGP